MKFKRLIILVFTTSCLTSGWSQTSMGINTLAPQRQLDIQGSNTQYLRVQSISILNNESGLELLRGMNGDNAQDWKITNTASGLTFVAGNDDFNSSGQTHLLMNTNGYLGIGTTQPAARLHITNGESATNTGDGYLLLGPKTQNNLVFDNNSILARNSGAPATLFIQQEGGSTQIGSALGTAHTYVPNGNVLIGGGQASALLNVQDDEEYQINLDNTGSANKWNIGASKQSWAVGDKQLVFTPNNSSSDAPLRLVDVSENDGTLAPVMIASSNNQLLLLDGNEIDSKNGPLYINHNSDNNTYLDPQGGKIGIGTTNPHGLVHINTNLYALAVQRGTATWKITTHTNGDILFNSNNGLVALVSLNSGATWVSLSDRNRKQDITQFTGALEKISKLALYSYVFRHQTDSSRSIGVMAQELEHVLPEAVFQDDNQYGVSYDQLTALAIRGIQEQQTEILELQALAASMTPKTGTH